MKWNKTFYLTVIFATIAIVFFIVTAIVTPLAPEYYDANNFYSILFGWSIAIAGISLVLAIGCLKWWHSYT